VDHERLEDFASRVRGARRTDELDKAAAEVLAAFDSAGVSAILLKGAALSRVLYTAEQRRGYSDVDLLVAPQDLTQAQAELAELGFGNFTAQRGVEDIAGAVHAETWIRRNEEIGPLMIDLHWRLPGVKAAPDIAWRSLAARRASIELGGREVPVLRREGLALHVATHAAQHGPDDPRPLADLRYALERWPAQVWQQAAELAAELDATVAYAAGLRLVSAGADLAVLLELPPSDDLEWDMRNRSARPRGTFHVQALVEARSLRERAHLVRLALLPKREWIVFQDPRAAKGGLPLVLARVRHVLRAPRWAFAALRYRSRRQRSVNN
jgi:hypothetical protein